MTVIGPQDIDDEVVDVTIQNLALTLAAGGKSGQDLPIDHLIVDGSIDTTMDGAPTLSVTVLDSDLVLLNSPVFTRTLDTTMDGVPHRLTKVSLLDDEQLGMQFEHRVVAWLRQHNTPLKASRGKYTRAEFIDKMVREVNAGPIRFVSPDLHKKQPVAKASQQPTDDKKKSTRAPGFADDANVKVKGQKASKAQIRQMDRALTVADSLNANHLATLALLCAGTGESTWTPTSPNSGGFAGVFQSDQINRTDTEQQAHYFLKGGKGFQAGGAMAYARAHPSADPGQIATLVEASGEAASFYGKYKAETEANLKLWNGGHNVTGSGVDGDGSETYWKTYEFTRGQAGGDKEDSWTCATRLAAEVRWRLFVTGRQSLWYVTDEYLIQSKPRYTITPTTSGLEAVNFDIEVGGRTILVRGKRVKKPSELTIRVHMDRWGAPAGSTIQLDGYGPADGRWLVEGTSRPIFDSIGTVTLRQPQKELQEPRGESATRSTSQSSKSENGSDGGGTTVATPLGLGGKVTIRAGANRSGVKLNSPIEAFLALVAAKTREPIVVSTGTNHNRYVLGTTRESDHWQGNAADIDVGGDARTSSAAGSRGDNIAIAALIVLGVDRATATTWAKGGYLDFGVASTHTWHNCRVQVGWRTMVGGNHYNHVHIGVQPGQIGRSVLSEIGDLASLVAGN